MKRNMAREFNRNMFIMLLAIMIGVIIITYFIADIINHSKIETLTTEYKTEITNISSKSENFTSYFIKSSVVLDQAREDLAFGNYFFDLAFLWYKSALAEKNNSNFELYKTRAIDNCTSALPNYIYSRDNYLDAKSYFNTTKSFTNYKLYLDILDLYINLTDLGSRLSMLRYNASLFLMYLTENLTYDKLNNNVTNLENVSELLLLFEITMESINNVQGEYDEYQGAINEYEFFDENR
ncbi:MAG: hypothetical protein QHH15_08225 [Candidatus Thermoplasmatota archaeon]|nr:hypothetical protein [Candidatus Thermoplasmatota archaeon]